MSAATYSDWEFWPGPLDESGNPPSDCSAYDRIYNVYDEDIRRYNESGEATADMHDWPWQLGAPVFDGDGNPDNYDLAAGDRPYVYGDQTAWWVMNDAGNAHRHSDAPPLGLEARVSAFAAERSEESWVRNATFYRYELVYRGASPVDSMYFGFWSDPDLGDSGDDYVGSDPSLGLAFVSNGDNEDGGTSGYADRPPALGYQFARGPLVDGDDKDNDGDGSIDEPGERMGATSFGAISLSGAGFRGCTPRLRAADVDVRASRPVRCSRPQGRVGSGRLVLRGREPGFVIGHRSAGRLLLPPARDRSRTSNSAGHRHAVM